MEKKEKVAEFDKYKSLEKLIYSVKYLPQILYFGSFGIILYSIYSSIFREVDFIPGLLIFPLIFFFFYMSHLVAKNFKIIYLVYGKIKKTHIFSLLFTRKSHIFS